MGENIGQKEIKWINCAKFMAIIAVLVDHTNGILYTNYNIALASYYSVALFILISGMMCWESNRRHDLNWIHTFVRASKNIFASYFLATFIYQIYIFRYFDLYDFLNYVISFNMSGPFYYVLLYLQLMLVSRFIYTVICRMERIFQSSPAANILAEIISGGGILFISYLTTNYTNILNVYGGGGRLLGGTYLLLFYMGMLFAKHNLFKKFQLKKSIMIAAGCSVLWCVWWKIVCDAPFALDAKLPFGAGGNPPSISIGVMAIITLFLSYGVFTLIACFKYTEWAVIFTAWIGKHTLYIFLYHRLFLDFVLGKHILIQNIWFRRAWYIGIMIFGSVFIEYAVKWTKTRFIDDGRQCQDRYATK